MGPAHEAGQATAGTPRAEPAHAPSSATTATGDSASDDAPAHDDGPHAAATGDSATSSVPAHGDGPHAAATGDSATSSVPAHGDGPHAAATGDSATSSAPAHDDAPHAAATSDSATSSAPAANGDVQLPVRIDAVEVPYPEAEHSAGREGEVLLRLTLDEHGTVTDSEVVRSAGPAFDEALRTASRSFRFEPARVKGEAVACQIELLHTFKLDTPAPVPVEAPAVAETPATPEPSTTEPQDKRLETTVSGRSEAERHRQSAEAVKIISIRRAQARSGDLGQVLASQEGVEVRRSGGLGSSAMFALNGLTDDQIRFFLDGVPLDLSGYPFGIANVPVNLVDSVQLYRGVVPIRYGADALGGAVNLTSAPLETGAHGAASLQGGAFGTFRLTLGGSYKPAEQGFYARAHFFADTTDNDYSVDTEVADERGSLRPVTVKRFHDGYDALGGGLEAGYTGLSWADRIVVRAFGSTHDKELQHNLVMRGTPYGEATYGADTLGAQVLYAKTLSEHTRLDVLAGYAWQATELVDVSEWVYDWFGNRVNPRQNPGEIGETATDQSIWQQSVYGRANLGWDLGPTQTLRLSAAPTLTLRTGEQRRKVSPTDPDRLAPERSLFTFVTGLEYETHLFDDALEVILFGKDYVYRGRAQQPMESGGWRAKDRNLHRLGGGAALRLRLTGTFYAKASYERATRMPRPDEVFGNGVLILENLDLAPEHSHNVNLGIASAPLRTRLGSFRGEVNGFARFADDLILLAGRDRDWSYQNVYAARILGVEGTVGWTSPTGLVSLDANATVQDPRNASDQGTFGAFDGRRLPNRPWLFANATARVSLKNLALADDELAPFWSTRYVHGFFRNWEGLGTVESKDTIDAQFVQAAGVGYRVRRGALTVGLTAELENLTDAKVFDFFGVERPGRAGWLKGTLEY
ncbi:TonB-dependent siderophore myxochelin receptor MxcH [Myxococcus sp. K15C18031901]|uniref:TonB-dependent siderophore myxochelin receptor MxcH n=1 Tax=Myxococcus dinghuensis TaxID=2906761 RepID=UPI0020A70120|nr:TonB-dependent siderophore myxochelin receptor MxcH [Myxococcus dinghuensis]MCP3104482.1 TonB-dependent siderophore myxochelin receptor MxcH [Myxococcus dinghuensis]